jgi:NADPH:quinone reductase-like Zn-dependent oxidoreductase
VAAGSVVKQPESLSFAEVASIWMMFVTAYSALIEDAKVTKGDFVLIAAASSSVGLAAIQIANYAGATSIALTRTSAKKKQLLDASAAHVIATGEVDLAQEAMRITERKGARIAFDSIGGPNFPKLISALGFQRVAYTYGALSDGVTTGNDRRDAHDQGPQHLAHKRRSRKAQDSGRLHSPRFRRRQAEDCDRSHLPPRQDRRSAPLPRDQRSVREDRRHALIP